MKFVKFLKNTYFEEHLQKTASICFTSKYYLTNNGGGFGLDETSTECKASISLKVTILVNLMQ